MGASDPVLAPDALAAADANVAVAARPAGALRARFRDAKTARIAAFLAARPTARAALRLVRALARDVDATLGELWCEARMEPADHPETRRGALRHHPSAKGRSLRVG